MGVFDRAKVLFRPGGDLPHIRDQPVGIAAVVAVEPLDPVEVLDMAQSVGLPIGGVESLEESPPSRLPP